MIPKSTVALYQSIKAPDSLQRHIDDKLAGTVPVSKKKNPWLPVLTAAACVAIVLVSALPQRTAPTLRSGGVQIGTAPVVVAQTAAMQRSAVALAAEEPLSITLELPKNANAEITVSHGEIFAEDSAGKFKQIRWNIADPQNELLATLALTIDDLTTMYTLHADAFGVWYMEKEQ